MFPLARRTGLEIEEAEDDLVLYDRVARRAHSLNRTAALIWRHADGETSVAALAALLHEELGIAADEEAVWFTLRRLEQATLLASPLQAPTAAARLTRREVAERLGLSGAFLLLAPAVTSLVAPEPALAASAITGGGGGGSTITVTEQGCMDRIPAITPCNSDLCVDNVTRRRLGTLCKDGPATNNCSCQ